MLSKESISWLRLNYPELIISPDLLEVKGKINMSAVYNSDTGHFLNLTQGSENTIGGCVLKGSFSISVGSRNGKLPALHVYSNNVLLISDRHFNEGDRSACLCGPIEEQKYLSNEFHFESFFENLIIPFLY